MFLTLQGMREEANINKVRALTQKLQTDDPKLPRKRKKSIHYEEEKAPAESVSTAKEHYCVRNESPKF